jgi:hypothetical protein
LILVFFEDGWVSSSLFGVCCWHATTCYLFHVLSHFLQPLGRFLVYLDMFYHLHTAAWIYGVAIFGYITAFCLMSERALYVADLALQ